MKKLLYSILLFILFIPVIVNAAECDTSKVYIDSISIDTSKGNVAELEEATAKDKKVNLNLRMATKDDEIVYKIVLKNDSEEDYEINKNSIKLDTDYLDYSLESDNNNIVKAKSSRTINLRVKYTTEVDPSKFVNGVYQDNVTMKVNLQSNDTPSNPNTGVSYIIIISLIILLSGILLIVFRKKRLSQVMIVIITLLLVIPFSVNALCKCEIELISKVTITNIRKYRVEFKACGHLAVQEFEFENGMTWNEYFNSSYYSEISAAADPTADIVTDYSFNRPSDKIHFKKIGQCDIDDLNCIRTENEIEETTKDSKIHPKEEGLYSVGDTDC